MIGIVPGALVPAKAAIIRTWLTSPGAIEFQLHLVNLSAAYSAEAANHLASTEEDRIAKAEEKNALARFYAEMNEFLVKVKAADYDFPTVQLMPEPLAPKER